MGRASDASGRSPGLETRHENLVVESSPNLPYLKGITPGRPCSNLNVTLNIPEWDQYGKQINEKENTTSVIVKKMSLTPC